jgi:GAF domain-containing protein/HAMP domain-containing protein
MQNFLSLFHYFDLAADRADLAPNQRSLYRLLQAALSYIPILLGFNALGFVVIYVLGLFGFLDKNETQILIVAAISLATSILHIPLFSMLRKGQFNLVSVLLLLIDGLGASAQILLWQGIIWFPLAMLISMTLVFVIQNGLGTGYRLFSFFFGVSLVGGIVYLDGAVTFDRMQVGNNLSQMAALFLYIIVIVAMLVLVLINSAVSFRTISSRLVTTFTFVAFLSAVATLIISALASLFFDRQRVFQELSALSATKTAQINTYLSNLERDASLYLTDPLIDQRIDYLLSNQPDTLLYQVNLDLVRAYLIKQQAQTTKYDEILLLDATGKSIISTIPTNKDQDFSGFNFFQNAQIGINSAIEFNFPNSVESTSVVVMRPITINGLLRGGLVARISFDSIKQIMAAETGLGETSETYLVGIVNGKLIPITNTRRNTTEVNSIAAQQGLLQHVSSGSAIYKNYAGQTVLGSYIRIPAIRATAIAEVEQQEINLKTFKILVTNGVIGIFTSILAFMIVFITSRSISLPLVSLAEKANALASGEFSTRMPVDRHDEIGALSSSFNTMASELQSLIKTLEQKVEDRTRDLQKQANYLRLASEVARDSANARSLNELLNQGAQIILDRFGFYHTGIFLLDEHNQYAILRASPTEPGQEMLARHHKLKVGLEGIVGNVASTGKPRIVLDTDQDAAYFNNPLLPMTRSEIALPLKVNEQLLGVLDVQSEQPEAFSQDDIATLQIMADQLALAIQRVELAEEQSRSLRELEIASRQFTLTNWQSFAQATDFKSGYKFDGMQITPVNSFSEENQAILLQGRSFIIPPAKSNDTSGASLAVPMKLRDQIIGTLLIQFNTETISPETISLIEETASRLAIALDNARLYTETQKFAERERTVSEITARIASSVNIENILRTFVQELGNHIPDSEVTVQLRQSNKKQ